jgi:hypothetical protein
MPGSMMLAGALARDETQRIQQPAGGSTAPRSERTLPPWLPVCLECNIMMNQPAFAHGLMRSHQDEGVTPQDVNRRIVDHNVHRFSGPAT